MKLLQGRWRTGSGARSDSAASLVEPSDVEPGDVVLRVTDLHAYIGSSEILHGVSFEVRKGGVTALLGRNGVGKTTTLRAILGLVERTGAVNFRGDQIGRDQTHRIIQRGIRYVPEDREVFSQLTVAENLRLAERPKMEARYGLVHDLFPRLEERRNQRAGTLSGGEQQMLALARALLTEADILLIDEPSKGLAPSVVTEVAEALERVSELSTVLLVEQNLQLVQRIARDAVVVDNGRVAYSGEFSDLLDDSDRVRDLLGVSAGPARAWDGGGTQ